MYTIVTAHVTITIHGHTYTATPSVHTKMHINVHFYFSQADTNHRKNNNKTFHRKKAKHGPCTQLLQLMQ